jgi:NNP family nitrate/nitrite transporter-like MFS transporter
VYFTTFGGFMALTGWLPRYWAAFHGTSLQVAGLLTAAYSILASLARVAGGRLSDRIGGIRTAGLALALSVVGAILMSTAFTLPLAVGAVLVMAVGMGIGNAAVFKLVPEVVPEAVGGAAGWIGGLGAFGGFVIPNLLAAFVPSGIAADPGYARGFAVLVVLDVLAIGIVWVLHRRGRRVGDVSRGS